MASPEITRAAQFEILSEKTLRYKRTTLVIASTIVVVELFLGVEPKSLNVLGVEIPFERALILLWFALIYNSLMTAIFGRNDWRNWIANLTTKPISKNRYQYFPEIRMYLGYPPQSDWLLETRWPAHMGTEFVRWQGLEQDKTNQVIAFIATIRPRKGGNESKTQAYLVPIATFQAVRRQLIRFWSIEAILPAAAVAGAILASIYSDNIAAPSAP